MQIKQKFPHFLCIGLYCLFKSLLISAKLHSQGFKWGITFMFYIYGSRKYHKWPNKHLYMSRFQTWMCFEGVIPNFSKSRVLSWAKHRRMNRHCTQVMVVMRVHDYVCQWTYVSIILYVIDYMWYWSCLSVTFQNFLPKLPSSSHT